MTSSESALVDVAWLHANLDSPEIIVLDASVPPVVPGFEAINSPNDLKLIPGSRRFDFDTDVCKPNSSLPHMMPSSQLFEERVRALGIGKDSTLVVYDDTGLYASPRAWWMFRAMGHTRVYVLDGGLPAWIAAGFPTVSDYEQDVPVGDFVADENAASFCDAVTVLAATEDASCTILDARSRGRFAGTEPEPRPGLRGGHMPNARSLPCRDVLDDRRLKPVEELKEIMAELDVADKKIITSCGSGITACILTLAAYEAGHRNLSVYDGSWVEWGQPSKLPVQTGE